MTNPLVVPYLDKLTPEDFNYLVDSINRSNTALSQQIKQSIPATNIPSSSNKLIFDYTVQAATASVTTDGIVTLNANNDNGYQFEFIIYNTSAAGSTYSMYYNNDITDTDYYRVALYAADIANSALITGNQTVPASGRMVLTGILTQDITGLVYCDGRYTMFNSNGTYSVTQEIRHFKQTAVSGGNLIRLDWKSSVDAHIDKNSRFRLWTRKSN